MAAAAPFVGVESRFRLRALLTHEEDDDDDRALDPDQILLVGSGRILRRDDSSGVDPSAARPRSNALGTVTRRRSAGDPNRSPASASVQG